MMQKAKLPADVLSDDALSAVSGGTYVCPITQTVKCPIGQLTVSSCGDAQSIRVTYSPKQD